MTRLLNPTTRASGSLFPRSRGDAGGVGGTDSQILLRGWDEEHSGIP
jgi:hypothetical protein